MRYTGRYRRSDTSLPRPGRRSDDAGVAAPADDVALLRMRHGAEPGRGPKLRHVHLIEPQPASVEDIRTALDANEAFVSFYFGREASFVWAVAKEGPIGFARLPLNVGDIVLEVSGQPIRDVAALAARMTALRAEEPASVVFLVRRGVRTTFLQVRPSWR